MQTYVKNLKYEKINCTCLEKKHNYIYNIIFDDKNQIKNVDKKKLIKNKIENDEKKKLSLQNKKKKKKKK
jgi:hypothetical protein